MKTQSKITNPESLLEWRRQVGRDAGVAVITGTFDLFQPGNLYAIRKAAAEARFLIVVVEPDEVVAGHVTSGRPLNPLESRIEMVSQLRDVSAVTHLAPGREAAFFAQLAPFVWVTTKASAGQDPYHDSLSATVERIEAIEPLGGCFTRDIIKAMDEHRTPIRLPIGWNEPRLAPSPPVTQAGVTVTVNGCFDILHVGHLRFLKEARAMGDSLTALINSDTSVVRYKGPTRPVFPEPFRKTALMALSPVDAVVTFPGDSPLDELARLRPMIHVKGGSYEPERVRQERELVEGWGGRLVCTPMVEGFSTTRFINQALHGTNPVHALP